jgi:hypothetical protein
MSAQSAPFEVVLKPLSIAGLTGLQSYAVGQSSGKWLMVGGRIDGLHRRQPFASFAASGNNNNILVVDPITKQKWISDMTSLPIPIQEQLSSTNMQFYQQDSFLYCIGGYGYSNTAADHITYPNLTAINISSLIQSIINGSSISGSFRQLIDAQFAITGGRLEKMYDTYYLVGGQKFDGRYNPGGMPTYTQVYSNQIKKFRILDDGLSLSVLNLPSFSDSNNLHRRDYNLVPQILPDGKEGLIAFSGVFQRSFDLPYLNCVIIDSVGYTVNPSFSQYYNHYQCPVLPIYSQSQNKMHNVFFGGISQYYDSAGVLIQDDNVPFVNTIARVSTDASGVMAEYKMSTQLFSLMGASAEFIPLPDISSYSNHVLKLDEIDHDTTLVGYIYGGINSDSRNIFFINTGVESEATNQILEVYLVKNSNTSIEQFNQQSQSTFQMQVYPNPSQGNFKLKFSIVKLGDIKLTISSENGTIIKEEMFSQLPVGTQYLDFNMPEGLEENVYLVSIENKDEKVTQKVIINK